MEENLIQEAPKPVNLYPKRRSPQRKVDTLTAIALEAPKPAEMTLEEKMKTVEWQRQRDKEMVRIRFVNNEQPGSSLSFPYRAYKGDRLEMYHFEDGDIREVPFGVAMHINYNCSKPNYSYLDKNTIAGFNPDQRKTFRITSLTNRFTAVPLNFRESDFMGPNHNRVLLVETLDLMPSYI